MTSFFPKSVAAQPAGDHATQMFARLEQGDRQTFAGGGDGGHDAACRAAVNDRIKLFRLAEDNWSQQQNRCQSAKKVPSLISPAQWW